MDTNQICRYRPGKLQKIETEKENKFLIKNKLRLAAKTWQCLFLL